jgi:3-hydroxybutyryl-CoA dehydrogenase
MSGGGNEKICVLGAGTMGRGIAQVAAVAGCEVLLYDVDKDILAKAVIGITSNLKKSVEKGKIDQDKADEAKRRISTALSLASVRADIFIEAALEDLDLKKKLFKELEKTNPADSIFASNTSSFPVTSIARDLKHPERVVGMHFFNPAHIMRLVEVISGAVTDPKISRRIFDLCSSWGKTPIMVNDSPGFVVNRVARHFYVESLKILEEGIADHQTIDKAIESLGFRMGPFRLMDLIGVDTNFSVTKSMYNSFHYDPKFRPSRIQEQKVLAGHHGKKSGKGFYDYP